MRGLEYRGGIFHGRRLLEGTPGTIDNFQLSIGVSQGDFYSPRHRHNFEQIRVQLDGTLDYDRDGKMTAGIVGYFPEGVFYGPQSQNPDEVATAAVLQFGGASGSGYLSNAETRNAMEELKPARRIQGRRVPPQGAVPRQEERRRQPGDLGTPSPAPDRVSKAALSRSRS